MIAPEEARQLVIARVRGMPAERATLPDAAGRVTTRDICAPSDLPRFTTSSMDGYAVSSRATRPATRARPVRLSLAARAVYAGSKPGPALGDGTAVRIMTGAPLPRGANAVIPQEEASVNDGALVSPRPVRRGRHVRRAAEDFRRGDVVVPKGTRLHAGAIAVLSMMGVRLVEVRRAPRVAIVVTGSEVRAPAARTLPAYAVWDSHASFLSAALTEFGITPVQVTHAPDDAPEIRRRLVRALARADLVIVTGGVSVGDRDLVRPVLKSLGARTIFWGVAQRPGKPLYFGSRRGVVIFGLPGNPASTVVCYCEYVRPAIRAMLGESDGAPEEWVARLASPVARGEARTRYLPGRLVRRGRGWDVRVDRRQGSNLLGSFLVGDCLVIVPAGPGRALRAGSAVRVHPLPWRQR